MEQYIPKSALVAEIERRKKQNEEWKNSCKGIDSLAASMVIQEDLNILSFIDTLEIKEVDLEKEIKDYFNNQPIITRSKGVDYRLIPSNEDIAKHFFELGLKAKGEEV